MQGPRRLTIQRERSGPAGRIGAPPQTSSPSASALARKRALTPYVSSGRRGGAGVMRPRNRADVINGNGAVNGNGNGAGMAPMDWLSNPFLWAAALGVLFLIRRKPKRG